MTAQHEHARWREERRAAVTAPEGNLALIETRWTGTPADLDAAHADVAESVIVTALTRTDIATGTTEHGIRFWDSASPAMRAFARIETYDYDPEWVVTGTFTPVATDRTVPFEHIRDNGGTRNLVVPGDIDVTIADQSFTLAAFDDGGRLLLVFADQTNGTETYGSGRFLFVERDIERGGTSATLDFNRAFVPPCGFSAHYNCPLPPASNRLPFPVRAGEKNVVFRDGFDPYAT